jgi:hypothetical protein
VFELDNGSVGPELLLNLLSRDQPAGFFQQEFQKLQRLPLQTSARPVPGERSSLQIQLEVAEAR